MDEAAERCTFKAELYAENRATTESMRVQTFVKDLDRVVLLRLRIVSSAIFVHNKQSRTGQNEAHRDPVAVTARDGKVPSRGTLWTR